MAVNDSDARAFADTHAVVVDTDGGAVGRHYTVDDHAATVAVADWLYTAGEFSGAVGRLDLADD